MTNRLGYETSPYLLQHAHNPVDWYPWSEEALNKAQSENKPIIVSIGYSTCHWCHVMERESFENEDVAAIMNENFICIKVDREERPDIDAVYMEACQIMTGGGGWPLNCFLTPEGQPFYAGTYFPPRPAHNRPSWVQLLHHLSKAWRERRDEVYAQAAQMTEYIKRYDKPPATGTVPEKQTPVFDSLRPFQIDKSARDRVGQVFMNMSSRFDREDGGFGGAPKFPGSMSLSFLMQFYYFSGHRDALDHVFLSLDKMCMGGIYDHLGGGFARYATDKAWLVPHFEKMLYDNALLVGVLSDACRILADEKASPDRLELYRETIDETLDWVEREMTHTSGGFFSAQDADSEGVEGKFFVWDKSEIESVLKENGFSPEETEAFCAFYDITAHGNWEEKNIIHRDIDTAAFAAKQGIEAAGFKKILRKARQALFAVRSKRIWPGLDDKILLGWNALMVSAFAQAYTATGTEKYRVNAVKSLEFLDNQFFDRQSGAAFHTWKNGAARITAFLEDYAFLIAAMIDVYQITFEEKWLNRAAEITELVIRLFYDPEDGLFFFTGIEQTDIILRKKDLYDNATPSGNSTMTRNLQRLSKYYGRTDWEAMAEKMLDTMHQSIVKFPGSFGRWAETLVNQEFPVREIAVVGPDAKSVAWALQQHYLPNTVIAAAELVNWPDKLKKLNQLPLLAGKTGSETTQIYICRNFACQRPVQTISEALASLHPQFE